MDAATAEELLKLLSAGNELLSRCGDGLSRGTDQSAAALDELKLLARSAEERIAGEDTPNRVREICKNIDYYINKLKGEPDGNSARFDFRYCLSSLYRILELEMAYLAEDFVDKAAYPALYPDIGTVDCGEIARKGREAGIPVSVVVLSYNHLDYARACVESILEHTQEGQYELILVDNGCTDGTGGYFDSVPGAKVIHLPYNLHVVKGFNIGLMAAEGTYSAAVCDDFLFTENWLNNLLICLRSDDGIGYVSPGATHISNLQRIDVPFVSPEEFQEEAKRFNRSDPRKWEERVVLLPNVLCCPTALLERIGYYDTRFYRGEFADDDISFRIRRAGYRLVYCGDTVTHHYGSVTTAVDHASNSLQEGKETFFQKYGLDAWADARMDPIYQNFSYDRCSQAGSVLGIDVKCGATLLQIKNEIWRRFGVCPALFSATTEEKYLPDLKTISRDAVVVRNFGGLPGRFHRKFDLIYVEKSLDCFSEDLDAIFSSLSKLTEPGGQLIFRLDNCASFRRIAGLLQLGEEALNRKNYQEEPVCRAAETYGFRKLRSLCLFNRERLQAIRRLSHAVAEGEEEDRALQELLLKETTVFQMICGG